ncbi:MAG: hypothetical protein ABMA25_05920 [Ilumatobacteraceae bacterium]
MSDIDAWGASFTAEPADLAANRVGQLSPTQREFYTRSAAAARRRPPIIMLLLVVVLGGMFAFLASQGTFPTDQLLMAAGATAVFVGIIGLISMLNYRQADKMANMQVLATQGHPRAWRIGGDLPTSKLEVGGVRFNLLSDHAEQFDETRVYRIYYAHIGVGTPVILSFEIVG